MSEKEKKQTKQKEQKEDNKDQQIKELKELLQKVQADYENYKKRVEKEKEEIKFLSKKEVFLKLLPIVDNFELALKQTENKEEFVKGVEMIYAQLHDMMNKEGLEQIQQNEKFDPQIHEAVMTEKSDKEEGTILEELQKGYVFKDKVIRHSRVKVSKDGQKDSCEKGE